MAAAGDDVPGCLAELADTVHRAATRLMRMRKPLLVLVNGAAAGAGLSLAISGDVVLASRSAHFTTAYGSVGLSPDGGMTWLLPRLVGMRRAQAMILRNQRVGAEEAAAIGLISEVVEDDHLALRGEQAAAELAAAPTLALGAARGLLLDAFNGPLESHLEKEARTIEAVAATKNCREGVSAFLARRKPDFNDPA
jgi:2-(1,2-epoxy-1,2-dihydrophenyl)acetyl-CoA isomerase